MAPTKPKPSSGKKGGKNSKRPTTKVEALKTKTKTPARTSKTPPKPKSGPPAKKKRRIYTEKELNIPKLNTIVPAGVQKPRGKKIGKKFVDDQESMMTILAMVNADKEGQIESKMIKSRQMEEIRQARQAEMEARVAEKKSKLEATKKSLRRSRKREGDAEEAASQEPSSTKPMKKRVSFG